MANRKRRIDPPENHERWLVSYADFITLLFAFFVVMFATSQADKQRAKELSFAVNEALTKGKIASRWLNIVLGGQSTQREAGNADIKGLRSAKPVEEQAPILAELTPSLKQLTMDLAEEIRTGRIEINLEPRGLVISLKEAAFFP